MAGKKVCVYIDEDAVAAFETLCMIGEARGKSMSHMVSRAVYVFCQQAVSGVRVSEGACACMARGKLDKLQYLHMPNVDPIKDGYEHIVVAAEEAHRCDPEVIAAMDTIWKAVGHEDRCRMPIWEQFHGHDKQVAGETDDRGTEDTEG